MVTENPSSPVRLLLIGIVAVATGFAIGSFARGGPDGPARPSYPESMSAEQMQTAMSQALVIPDTLERALAIDALVQRLDENNADGAAAAIDPIVIGLDDCDVKPYFQKRARFDPIGAFQHAMEWSSIHKRGLGVNATALVWALDGGALEARSFVESIEAEETRNAGMNGLLQGWARSNDVKGITQFLANMPDDPKQTRNDVLLAYLTVPLLAYGGPDRLIEWLEGIPEDAPNGFKRAAYRNALLQLASTDPNRAVALYQEHSERDYAANSMWLITIAWQKLNPEETFAWILDQPESNARTNAATRAMQRWFSRDRRSAAVWVRQTELGQDPELRKRLYAITRQVKRLHELEARAEAGV